MLPGPPHTFFEFIKSERLDLGMALSEQVMFYTKDDVCLLQTNRQVGRQAGRISALAHSPPSTDQAI